MKKTIFQLLLVFLLINGVLYLFVTIGPKEAETVGKERDIEIPRAPEDKKFVKNPFPASSEIVSKGSEIYHGKGGCFACHGREGKGDGPAGSALNPRPRNFANPRFHEIRTDGELFWVIQNGSPGTGMFSYSPSYITEEETWMVIRYIRTIPKEIEKSLPPNSP
ncbi:MAG: cytochrome c [Nitrospirae bacterium]|nr:cytochrome c [Nitrospirota bacterium]MBI3593434.1 cytochrome c [Nitrospirota bacterium]